MFQVKEEDKDSTEEENTMVLQLKCGELSVSCCVACSREFITDVVFFNDWLLVFFQVYLPRVLIPTSPDSTSKLHQTYGSAEESPICSASEENQADC